MIDDIVARLHLEADEWCFDGPVRIFLEAADEIERLREERKQWIRIAKAEHQAWSQCASDCVCLNDAFEKTQREND